METSTKRSNLYQILTKDVEHLVTEQITLSNDDLSSVSYLSNPPYSSMRSKSPVLVKKSNSQEIHATLVRVESDQCAKAHSESSLQNHEKKIKF